MMVTYCWVLLLFAELPVCTAVFANSGARPLREARCNYDAILQGARMTPGNRGTFTTSIDNCLLYSEWGALNIFHRGALQKLNEKH